MVDTPFFLYIYYMRKINTLKGIRRQTFHNRVMTEILFSTRLFSFIMVLHGNLPLFNLETEEERLSLKKDHFPPTANMQSRVKILTL